MDQLVELLQDNNVENFEIITHIESDASIPDLWKQIIVENNETVKVELVKKYWLLFKDKLPKTYTLINDHLKNAVVIKDGEGYKLVYIIEIDDFDSVYVGLVPTQTGPFLDLLPDDIAAFYKTIHNGWYENISGGLGFLPLEKMSYLSEHEWGILDEIEKPPFDLSDVFYIFHNAGPGYLCIDVTNKKDVKYLIFWTDRKPKLGIDFWSFMDSWIEIGLTN